VSGSRIGAEFNFLVQCCRWNFAHVEGHGQLKVPIDLDWNLVAALARRHRVQGLIWNALAPQANVVPDHVKELLSSDTRSIAATNLGIAAECRSLLQAFENAKIQLLFVKGLTVGTLAYRSPLLKMGWDIDLLIDAADLEKAAGLLTRLGYSLRIPFDMAELRGWHGQSKESVWHRNQSLHVELHTRLSDNVRLIPTINVHSPRQLVEIAPSISLPTLADDELLAYLAVHGASSAWFRLKWVSDFAALLFGRSGNELERLHHRSQQLGAARAFGQALLIADRLFDVLEPNPRLRELLANDRSIAVLCRAALRIMTNEVSDPTERPLGTLAIHWTQFLLHAGLGFKYSELQRQFRLLISRQH
jgi:hypothetical protein